MMKSMSLTKQFAFRAIPLMNEVLKFQRNHFQSIFTERLDRALEFQKRLN